MQKSFSRRSLNTDRMVGCLFSVLLILLLSSCVDQETQKKAFLFGKGYGINEVTLLTRDLTSARQYFKDTLGFELSDEIEAGAIEGTLALTTFFPDMATITLVSPNDTLDELTPPYIGEYLAMNEGIRMYSFSSSSADSTAMWLTSQGFFLDSIRAFRISEEVSKDWNWDDGGPQRKQLDFNTSNPSPYLPRFEERVNYWYETVQNEWKTVYSYGRSDDNHPNGVVGIAAIRIAVENLKAASEEFQKMGFQEIEVNDSLVRYRIVRNQELHLVTSQSENDEIAEFINTRGQGVFALRFEVINLDSTYQFLLERLPEVALSRGGSPKQVTVKNNYAFGVQMEFVEEPMEQRMLAEKLRPADQLDSTAAQHAAGMYAKYCSLCHGDNREGYAADFAPSLRSHSLLASAQGSNFMRYTIHYGRAGTAMAGYLKNQGGPLEYIEIDLILQWLYESSGVEEPVEISREPVVGDVALGSSIYATNCATCHGVNGEGISAPALGNPMLLATATDHFLRYAIAEGRDGTPMKGFKDVLSDKEIDDVTAFLRSRASGWDVPAGDTVMIPPPEKYVLNPDSKAPDFTLREGKYLPAEQLIQALRDSLRLVILDARSEVAWRQTHIPGSIPVPYYEEPENFVDKIPNDSTWIVVYCACPHAASNRVVNTLRRNGFNKTAILDEGILVWAQMGLPVKHGN